ncbi:MAG: transposase [Prochloraceae cyanobacterium]|nr:transposase [Prochloraceae cyanobacterium]
MCYNAHMLTLNYTYRIDPTEDQKQQMLSWLETCRRLYNRCLRDLKDWLNSRSSSVDYCSIDKEYIMSPDIPFPSYIEQKKQLTQWKKTNPYFKKVYSQVTQDVVKRMHNTWEAFRKRGFGFPRFKKFGQYRSFYYPQFKKNPLTGYQIKLPMIGEVRINQHRPIPEGFKVKAVRIVSRARNTKWYAVVTIQSDVSVPDVIPYGRAIGIDIGLENFLTTSDGFTVRPARFFKDLQSELKSLQRKASRKKKRSKNCEKAQVKVAKLHHKIANTRKNFHLQVSHELCDHADMIFVEDIDFRVSAKGFLGKNMLDASFGQFRTLLSWVCWKRGKYFAEVDHKYTSQICPHCNTHTGKKELSEREHNCPECGYSTTRDIASAQIIKQRGENNVVPLDVRERKLPADCVLSGINRLDKCNAGMLNCKVEKPTL